MLKIVALTLFLLLVFPAKVVSQEKKLPKYGGTLRMGSHRDADSLNPFVSTQSETRRIRPLVYEPLITTDAATYDRMQREMQFAVTPRGGEVSIEPDDIYYPDYHSETGEKRLANFSGFSHSQVDRLLEEGRKTLNEDKRKEIYRKVMEIINDETPEINLAFISRFFGFRSHIRDFRIEPVRANFYHPGGQGWGLPFVWIEK